MFSTIGKPVSYKDRSKWSMSKLVKETRKLIRSDFGGSKDPVGVIVNKARQNGITLTRRQAEFVKGLITDQVAGCRKRVSHNLGMLEDRVNGF